MTDTLREIADLVDLPGPMGDDPKRVVENVRGLRENYNRICDRLQTCVQKHRLGLGGEHIDELVVEEIERLRELIAKSRLPHGHCRLGSCTNCDASKELDAIADEWDADTMRPMSERGGDSA